VDPHATTPWGVSVISNKWLFKNKLNPDGTLERRKARWVVHGFKQWQGIDFDQTFSPVVKPGTIRTVLHLAASRGWSINQLNVRNAFLHGKLAEQVYCLQPIGFINTGRPDHVCRLSKSLYGLKQAPRAWYHRFSDELWSIGFTATNSDTPLFVYKNGTDITDLHLYVDDIMLMASSTALLQRVTRHISTAFALKDLRPLHFFLSIHCSAPRAASFFTRPSTPTISSIALGCKILHHPRHRSTPSPSLRQTTARRVQMPHSIAAAPARSSTSH
jgi:hypothetical protein